MFANDAHLLAPVRHNSLITAKGELSSTSRNCTPSPASLAVLALFCCCFYVSLIASELLHLGETLPMNPALSASPTSAATSFLPTLV